MHTCPLVVQSGLVCLNLFFRWPVNSFPSAVIDRTKNELVGSPYGGYMATWAQPTQSDTEKHFSKYYTLPPAPEPTFLMINWRQSTAITCNRTSRAIGTNDVEFFKNFGNRMAKKILSFIKKDN